MVLVVRVVSHGEEVGGRVEDPHTCLVIRRVPRRLCRPAVYRALARHGFTILTVRCPRQESGRSWQAEQIAVLGISPAGTYTLAFDTGAESKRVSILNTTDHNKEELQTSGVTQRLTACRHSIRSTFRLTPSRTGTSTTSN